MADETGSRGRTLREVQWKFHEARVELLLALGQLDNPLRDAKTDVLLTRLRMAHEVYQIAGGAVVTEETQGRPDGSLPPAG